jgi:RNA polymerase sigma factor (TIGR02999 family)
MESPPNPEDVQRLLRGIAAGDSSARDRLLEISYAQLRQIAGRAMRRESGSHTLQPTALIHEAVIRIFQQDDMPTLPNRAYFYGTMASAMKRILVEHARKRQAKRRGGDHERLPLDETILSIEQRSGIDLLSLDEALNRLEDHDRRSYEVVVLRFFAEMEHQQIADELGVSLSTVHREWRFARAWLKQQLGGRPVS